MTDEEYRQKAREQYGKDGEIEIDDDADVSRGHDHPPGQRCGNADPDGAYVQAWVWVAHSTDPPIRQTCWQCHKRAPTEECGRCSDCCGTAKHPNKGWSSTERKG